MLDIYFSKPIKIDEITENPNITLKDGGIYYHGNCVLHIMGKPKEYIDCTIGYINKFTLEFLAYLYSQYKILWGFDGYKNDGAFAAMHECRKFERAGLEYNNKSPHTILVNYYYPDDMLQFEEFFDTDSIQELIKLRDISKKEYDELEKMLVD